MSPKSRGRPRGRGRPIQKRHPASIRPLTLHERILMAARCLGYDAPRLEVETAASQWLGEAWAKAAMQSRHAERDLVEALFGELPDVVGSVGGNAAGNVAYLALAALDTVAAPDEHDLIQQHIASSRLHLVPDWSGEDPATPLFAWRASDAYGSAISIFVAYGGQEPHELAVFLTTVGGLWVAQIGVLEAGAHTMEGVTGVGTHAEEITPEQALSQIAEALLVTDLYWPPQTDSSYYELRALAHSQSRRFAVSWDRQPISDDERQVLIDAFVTENDALAPEEVLRILADTFIDFGDGSLFGGVLAWSPGEVEHFLTDWVVRKVILDANQRAALPEVLRSWLSFALRRRGLPERNIAPVVATVDELEDEFLDAYDDESQWGLEEQVLATLLARGVDVWDRDAVEDGIREDNAEQLARSLEQSQE